MTKVRDKTLESISSQSDIIAGDFAIFSYMISREAKYLFSNSRSYFL